MKNNLKPCYIITMSQCLNTRMVKKSKDEQNWGGEKNNGESQY